MSRPGPQSSTSWHSSGNLQAQALSATAGHHHGATLQDSNSSILAQDNEFTVYIGESHFFTGCASRNRLSAGIAAYWSKNRILQTQSNNSSEHCVESLLIPSSIRLCLLMKRRSRCSITQGLLFFTLITGVTLRSCLVLLVSLKWLGTGLSRSESMSYACCFVRVPTSALV